MVQLAQEIYKGPKPMIPVDWIWGVDKFLEDKAGAWYVEGYCSTHDLDLVGDIVTKEASQAAADQLVGLTLLYNHDPDEPIGTVVAAKADDKGIWVKCLISKTEPKKWEKIKEGVLNKFSIRLLERDSKKSNRGGKIINMIKSMVIKEISLTSLPANPRALAGMAYVGKSYFVEGNAMSKENLEVVKTAVEQLLQDYKDGKLADIVESLKQDETYGYGSLCPFYGNADVCPVLKEKAEGAKRDEVAKGCENAKIYTCPYLQSDYSVTNYPLPSEGGATVALEVAGAGSQPAPGAAAVGAGNLPPSTEAGGQKSLEGDKIKAKGYGDDCPYFEKEGCPVEDLAETKSFKTKYPKPGKYPEPNAAGAEEATKAQKDEEDKLGPKVKECAKNCEKAKTYTCPYLTGEAAKAPTWIFKPSVPLDESSKSPTWDFKPAVPLDEIAKAPTWNYKPGVPLEEVAKTLTGVTEAVKSIAMIMKQMETNGASVLAAVEAYKKYCEDMLNKGSEATSTLSESVGSVAKTLSDLVGNVKAMAGAIKSMKTATQEELKTTTSKIKSLESLAAPRRGLPAEDAIEDDPERKKNFWEGCFPI